MRVPLYASILLKIERITDAADGMADSRRVGLTDPTFQSLLVRSINEAKGKVATGWG